MVDTAKNFKAWLKAFFTGHTHVAYAGIFINIPIGSYLTFQPPLTLHVIGLVLILAGAGIAVDEAAHLFTN